MPQGHKNKSKGVKKAKGQIPKNEQTMKEKNEGKIAREINGETTAKMGVGTPIRSQPANFAGKSNLTSLLIKTIKRLYSIYKLSRHPL